MGWRSEASSCFNLILRSLRRLSFMHGTDHSTLGERTNYSRARNINVTCRSGRIMYPAESSCRFRAFHSIRWLIDEATWIDNMRKAESDFEYNWYPWRRSRFAWDNTFFSPLPTFLSDCFVRRFPSLSQILSLSLSLLLSRYIRRYTSRNAHHYKGPDHLDIDLQFRRQLRKAQNMFVQIRSD